MAAPPFLLLRPWLLLHGAFSSRDRPNLARIGSLTNPDRFVWEILPHAARTFAVCIILLPARFARASAVAYLYCRMLDTMEDLSTTPVEGEAALAAFAERMRAGGRGPPPPVPGGTPRDQRDRSHQLLVRRCGLVDEVYQRLAPEVRGLIADLVCDMAEGMGRFSRLFREQGGVLVSDEQVAGYCRAVIGNPVVFILKLLALRDTGSGVIDPVLHRAAMEVSEMVQLANITRDIEADLARGIAYRPELRDDLGRSVGGDPALARRVKDARRELLLLALSRAPAYRTVLLAMGRGRVSLSRGSALLMLLYTERYFESCARRAGLTTWSKSGSGASPIVQATAAVWSRGFALERCERVERAFLGTAARA